MGGLRLRLSHVLPSVWVCKLKDTRRLSTLERDEAPVGLADKFCLSPVNCKSMDISYTTRNEGSETVVAVKKRHLRRATVVSVGCGCRGRRGANKKETKTKLSPANADVKGPTKDYNDYCWEKEDGWHVIAKVNDEIVRKKVVLKRRTDNSGKKCPPGSPVSSPDVINSCLARALAANVQTRKKKKKKKKKSMIKPSESTCNYRLSTSSADTVLEASTYSWDKEYGSFTSDDDQILCSSFVNIHKSLSTQSSFELSEAPHLSTIDESPRNSNSRRVSLKARRRSAHKKLHKRHRDVHKKLSADLSPKNCDMKPVNTPCPTSAEKLPLLSSPDSAKLEVKDDTISTTSSSVGGGGYDQNEFYPWLSSETDDLEANAKTWRESMRRDDIRTVIYKSSDVDSNPHCLPFAMVTKSCQDGKVARRSSSTKKKAVHSRERNRTISDRKCSPRKKLDNDLSVNNRVHNLPSGVHGKVRESVAVVKSSEDPYQDFRSSMLEMILEKQIYHSSDLEQLLQCFLSLNSRQHHEVIVQVFTEIWGKIFCSSRNPSTPVTFFSSDG